MAGWDACPGCSGKGFWYSPDNGQVVTCNHAPEKKSEVSLVRPAPNHLDDPEYFLPGYESS